MKEKTAKVLEALANEANEEKLEKYIYAIIEVYYIVRFIFSMIANLSNPVWIM